MSCRKLHNGELNNLQYITNIYQGDLMKNN